MWNGLDWVIMFPLHSFTRWLRLACSPTGSQSPTVGFPMLFIASVGTLNQIYFGDLTTWSKHPTELVQEIIFISIEEKNTDTYSILSMRGWRYEWKDILKRHSFYLNWIYMNGYSSTPLQRQGRRVLKQTGSNGRHLVKAFLNPPSSSIAGLVSSPPLGPQPVIWTSAHWGAQWQLGEQTQEMCIEWKVEEHCLCKEKVPSSLSKTSPSSPPQPYRHAKNLKRASMGNSVLTGMMFSPSAFLQAVCWVHYWLSLWWE